MEEFLTKKAKNRIWEIPLLVGLGLFILAGISVVADDFGTGITSTDIIADAIVLFIFVFPFTRILIRRIRVRKARRIGEALSHISGASTGLADLQRESRMPGSMERNLRILLEKNFLQGIRPDFGSGKVYLVSAAREEKAMEELERTEVVECQACGARNTVIRGRSSKCPYCDSPLKIRP